MTDLSTQKTIKKIDILIKQKTTTMYQTFTKMLIAKDMTDHIKTLMTIPELDLKRDMFYFSDENNHVDKWYLVRTIFVNLQDKLLDHEISYFNWCDEIFIGLNHDIKDNKKLQRLYQSYF